MSTNMQRTPAFVLCGNLAVSTRIAKPACKNQQFVGQVETQKGSEVCSSDFNNACRVFGADWSIKICSNNFVGEEDKLWRYRFPLSLLFRGHLLP